MPDFKKMKLIPKEEYEQLKAKQLKEYDPKLTVMARLQMQMDDILNNESFSKLLPEERLQLFQRIHHRFRELKEEPVRQAPKPLPTIQLDEPEQDFLTPPGSPTPVVPQEVEQPAAVHEVNAAMIGIRKQYHKRAAQLLKLIDDNKEDIAVNKRNEIIVRGELIPNSNFTELFHDLFVTKKSELDQERPTGSEEFKAALRYINAPSNYVVNPFYSKYSRPKTPIHSQPKTPMHSHKRLKSASHSIHTPQIITLADLFEQ